MLPLLYQKSIIDYPRNITTSHDKIYIKDTIDTLPKKTIRKKIAPIKAAFTIYQLQSNPIFDS